MLAQSAPGVFQAILSAILLIGVLLLYLRRFAAPWRWVAVALAVCVLDQAAKFLLPLRLQEHQVSLLGGYLRLSYTRNWEQGFGGAFSYLLLVTAICVGAMYFLYAKLAKTGYRMSALAELGCALMIGGYWASCSTVSGWDSWLISWSSGAPAPLCITWQTSPYSWLLRFSGRARYNSWRK